MKFTYGYSVISNTIIYNEEYKNKSSFETEIDMYNVPHLNLLHVVNYVFIVQQNTLQINCISIVNWLIKNH